MIEQAGNSAIEIKRPDTHENKAELQLPQIPVFVKKKYVNNTPYFNLINLALIMYGYTRNRRQIAYAITITRDGFFQDGAAVLAYSIYNVSKSQELFILSIIRMLN